MIEMHVLSIPLTYPTFQNSIEPSEPPELKSPSCMGCHETELASFLWPRKTWASSFRLRMSNSLSKWSLEAVISQFPLSFHFKSITVDLWACLRNGSINVFFYKNSSNEMESRLPLLTMLPKLNHFSGPTVWWAVDYLYFPKLLSLFEDANGHI